MRNRFALLLMCGLVWAASPVLAQRPGDGDKPAASSAAADAFVARMMKFNKSKDGKLTKDEVTDKRLLPLFERADTNHDGVVTVDELKALYAKEGATLASVGAAIVAGPTARSPTTTARAIDAGPPTGQDPMTAAVQAVRAADLAIRTVRAMDRVAVPADLVPADLAASAVLHSPARFCPIGCKRCSS